MNNQHAIDGEIIGHEDSEAYFEVRRRRVLAFLVDYLIIAILCIPAAMIVAFAGIVTFGLGWLLFGILVPLVAITYIGLTLGGPNQATVGMAMFSLRISRLDGGYVEAPLAILHGIVFWLLHSVFSPFLLLASLFSSRKRLLHDWLLGTEITRSEGVG